MSASWALGQPNSLVQEPIHNGILLAHLGCRRGRLRGVLPGVEGEGASRATEEAAVVAGGGADDDDDERLEKYLLGSVWVRQDIKACSVRPSVRPRLSEESACVREGREREKWEAEAAWPIERQPMGLSSNACTCVCSPSPPPRRRRLRRRPKVSHKFLAFCLLLLLLLFGPACSLATSQDVRPSVRPCACSFLRRGEDTRRRTLVGRSEEVW